MKPTLNVLVFSVCTAVAGFSAGPAFAAQNSPVTSTGAVFTTGINCITVNGNIYDLKSDVYLNGGPDRPNSAGLLSNTSYYVQVTDPSGTTLLGSSLANTSVSTTPITTNSFGNVVGCSQLQSIVSLANGMLGYADTPNNGGEYKVWISTDPTFANQYTKTDNFKVKGSIRPEDPTGKIDIIKFYDANANGYRDVGELDVIGWKVDLMDFSIQFTPAQYTGLSIVNGQTYTAREYQPVQPNWYATTPTPMSTTPVYLNQSTVELSTTTPYAKVEFGNVCTGAGGGFTLGYWSNKNGQAAMTKYGTLALFSGLQNLFLVNKDGTPFDPSQLDQFRTWLLGGTAVNMANMLSVQLAAMYLNVTTGSVTGDPMIYAPGVPGANIAGFAPVSVVMTAANTSLSANSQTLAGNPQRATQEMIKNALDMANNNRTFVKLTPCEFTFTAPLAP